MPNWILFCGSDFCLEGKGRRFSTSHWLCNICFYDTGNFWDHEKISWPITWKLYDGWHHTVRQKYSIIKKLLVPLFMIQDVTTCFLHEKHLIFCYLYDFVSFLSYSKILKVEFYKKKKKNMTSQSIYAWFWNHARKTWQRNFVMKNFYDQ